MNNILDIKINSSTISRSLSVGECIVGTLICVKFDHINVRHNYKEVLIMIKTNEGALETISIPENINRKQLFDNISKIPLGQIIKIEVVKEVLTKTSNNLFKIFKIQSLENYNWNFLIAMVRIRMRSIA